MNEAQARIDLAALDVDRLRNYAEAAELLVAERHYLAQVPTEYARFTLYEANARHVIALDGDFRPSEWQLALELYAEARKHMEANDPQYGHTLLNEAFILNHLATNEPDCAAHLTRAAALVAEAKHHIHQDSAPHEQLAVLAALVHERTTTAVGPVSEGRHQATEDLPDPLNSIETAVEELTRAKEGNDPVARLRSLVAECRRYRIEVDIGNPIAELIQSMAEITLAEYGINAISNLSHAAALCQGLRKRFRDTYPISSMAANTEGLAQLRSARYSDDPQACLIRAVTLCREGRTTVQPVDRASRELYSAILSNEALALVEIAAMRVDPISNAELAVQLCAEGKRFSTSGDAQLRMNEGTARRILAHHGHASSSNLKTAISLYHEALSLLTPGTPDWGIAQRNLARALIESGRSSDGYRVFVSGLEVVERTAGMFRNESLRTAFLEQQIHNFLELAKLCLQLAFEASDRLDNEHWVLLAWHWGHASRARAFRDVMVVGRHEVGNRLEELLDVDRLSCELALLERTLAQKLRSNSVLLSEADSGKGPTSDGLVAGFEAKVNLARVAYEEKRNQLLSALFTELPQVLTSTPTAQRVIKTLQQLAGFDEQGAVIGRPLFIDFIVLSPTNLIVYVFPIWMEAVPVVRNMKLEGSGLAEDIGRLEALLEEASRPWWSREPMPDEMRKFESFLEYLGRLFEPLSDLIQELQPTEVVLSPHALLQQLPLHAATWSGKALIERYPVTYLPAMAFLGDAYPEARDGPNEVLLVGNPLGDLPAADDEVDAIARIARDSGFATRVLLRQEATTSMWMASAGEARVLHFACHSAHDSSDLLRSGWELHDRRLSVLDVITQMELGNAALVFLNSCESGRSNIRLADEVEALARAFLYSARPALVATLWSVNDRAGRCFAEVFYESWLTGKMTLAGSFQRAILRTKEEYPSPLLWAPFVAMGPWNATMARTRCSPSTE